MNKLRKCKNWHIFLGVCLISLIRFDLILFSIDINHANLLILRGVYASKDSVEMYNNNPDFWIPDISENQLSRKYLVQALDILKKYPNSELAQKASLRCLLFLRDNSLGSLDLNSSPFPAGSSVDHLLQSYFLEKKELYKSAANEAVIAINRAYSRVSDNDFRRVYRLYYLAQTTEYSGNISEYSLYEIMWLAILSGESNNFIKLYPDIASISENLTNIDLRERSKFFLLYAENLRLSFEYSSAIYAYEISLENDPQNIIARVRLLSQLENERACCNCILETTSSWVNIQNVQVEPDSQTDKSFIGVQLLDPPNAIFGSYHSLLVGLIKATKNSGSYPCADQDSYFFVGWFKNILPQGALAQNLNTRNGTIDGWSDLYESPAAIVSDSYGNSSLVCLKNSDAKTGLVSDWIFIVPSQKLLLIYNRENTEDIKQVGISWIDKSKNVVVSSQLQKVVNGYSANNVGVVFQSPENARWATVRMLNLNKKFTLCYKNIALISLDETYTP